VDLHVKPGETIAFVGHTGAGKTTITSLVSRGYEVTGGAIRIDGHDIRDVTVLDEATAYVDTQTECHHPEGAAGC
jgi:ABC-type multidrug transport system fused ATPase/permease subunit